MEDKNEILFSLHRQFAENQNQHQGIFIQFIIALFTLFAGFSYVYTHTNPEINYNQTFIQEINAVVYFSSSILVISSVVVLAVLVLLIAIILNQGYGFRRDQHLNKIIRQTYLINGEYNAVFGKLFNPDNKNSINFLPNFYSIFYWFILGFQIFLFIATFCKEKILNFEDRPFSFILFVVDILLIFLSICIYCRTYHKYKQNIKE